MVVWFFPITLKLSLLAGLAFKKTCEEFCLLVKDFDHLGDLEKVIQLKAGGSSWAA